MTDCIERQVAVVVSPLFSSESVRLNWLRRRIIYKDCELKKPIAELEAGQKLARVVIYFGLNGWEFRLYIKNDKKKVPDAVCSLVADFGELISTDTKEEEDG